MPPVRTSFQSGSIEWSSDPAASKQLIIETIGHLFVHAGRSILDAAKDPDFPIPESFTLIREMDGWDMHFVLNLNDKRMDVSHEP